jgi:hypothetical protein
MHAATDCALNLLNSSNDTDKDLDMHNLKLGKQLTSLSLAIAAGFGIASSFTPSAAAAGLNLGGTIGWGQVDGSDFNDDNPVYKIFAGGKFNDYVGVEVAAHDFGEAKDKGYSSKLRGYSAAVVGYLPLGDNFDLFAKIGNLWWHDKVSVLDTFHKNIDGDEIFYGVGANFNFNETLALRLEMERYKVDLSQNEIGVKLDNTYNVDVASIGLQFSF